MKNLLIAILIISSVFLGVHLVSSINQGSEGVVVVEMEKPMEDAEAAPMEEMEEPMEEMDEPMEEEVKEPIEEPKPDFIPLKFKKLKDLKKMGGIKVDIPDMWIRSKHHHQIYNLLAWRRTSLSTCLEYQL